MPIEFILNHIIDLLLTAVCGGLVVYIKTLHSHYRAMEDGIQSLLRESIVDNYNKYSDKGYCPIYAKESLKKVYIAYNGLGGNDVATELYQKILHMPEER